MRNMIVNALSEGWHHANIKERYLTMRMLRDFGDEQYHGSPILQDIFEHLVANDAIDNKDISTEYRGPGNTVPTLNVRLSPSFTLHIEKPSRGLRVMVNDSIPVVLYPGTAANVVMWVIRQKQRFDKYLEEWELLFGESAKINKGKRMAFLAIKAIFTEAMKDYPELKYEIIEQKRRARILVEIPNSNLSTFVDGWWSSYQQLLPRQIESLKSLIDAHRNSVIKRFYSSRSYH